LTTRPRARAKQVGPFVEALRALIDGRRDRRLVKGEDLDYREAAEITLLLDKLEGRRL
jgi:hypothetical protein